MSSVLHAHAPPVSIVPVGLLSSSSRADRSEDEVASVAPVASRMRFGGWLPTLMGNTLVLGVPTGLNPTIVSLDGS